MDAFRVLMVSSLVLLGCSETLPRKAMLDEQRRIEGAVRLGTSAQDAAATLQSLGYSCRAVGVDTAATPQGFPITDCVKKVEGGAELHVCLNRAGSEVKDVRYERRACLP